MIHRRSSNSSDEDRQSLSNPGSHQEQLSSNQRVAAGLVGFTTRIIHYLQAISDALQSILTTKFHSHQELQSRLIHTFQPFQGSVKDDFDPLRVPF